MKVADKLLTYADSTDAIDKVHQILQDITPQAVRNRSKPLQPITLILLDINMPVLNGFETLSRVKEMFTNHNQRLNIECENSETR